jgi:hypothetical protein
VKHIGVKNMIGSSKRIKSVRFASTISMTNSPDLKDHGYQLARHTNLGQDTNYGSSHSSHEQDHVSHDDDSGLSEMDEGGMTKLSLDIGGVDWATVGGSIAFNSD